MSLLCSYWLILVAVLIDSAWLMYMISKGQMLIVKAGETVHLECEFNSESFSLFENPTVWRKAQRLEESQINMMGNLLEPFASAKRFRATFQPHAPRFLFGLTITDVSLEDNGNYTCHISGPHNSVLLSVTHYIFVTAPVDRVVITDDNSTSADLSRRPNLVYTENHFGLLRCVALGGSPPPDIHVYLDQDDVTTQLTLTRTPTLTRRKGLRLVYYTTERSTHLFRVQPKDDGKMVKCVVSVPGSPSNYSLARITVHFAALITCDETEAFVGERNAFLRCEIIAKPKPGAIFWIINSNGTTVAEGDIVDGYWTLLMDRTDEVLETQLFIKQTTLTSFRRYTLVAENSVTVRTKDVDLRQRYHTTPKTDFAKQRGSYQSKQELQPRGLVSKLNDATRIDPDVTFCRQLKRLFFVVVLNRLVIVLR